MFFVLRFWIAALVCLGAFTQQAAASKDWPADNILIREDGSDLKVTFALPAGKMVEYSNDEQCPGGHKTSKGRSYNHFHITYTLPQTGIDETGKERTVTADKIKSFWDNQYKGYKSSGSEDISRNCHAFTFWRVNWIQDNTFLLEDECSKVTKWIDTNALTSGNNHSMQVYFVSGGIFDTIRTKEVNGPSRIYEYEWTCSSPKTATDRWRWKQ